jgi:hypothetical protein
LNGRIVAKQGAKVEVSAVLERGDVE